MAGKRGNGEGNISRRIKNGKTVGWKGSISVGYRPDGHLDRRWVSGKTQQEVIDKMRELQSQIHTGMVPSSSGMMVGDWLTRWADDRETHGVKPNTVRSYRDTARLYIVPLIGRLKLDKLRPTDVQSMMTRLRQDGKSDSQRSYVLRILKMALRTAVQLQLVPRNVAEAIKAPKVERPEMQFWTAEEADKFLKEAEKHRLGAAFYLALMTGMRRGELLGLCWGDIDFPGNRLSVRHNLVETRLETEGREYLGKKTVSRVVTELTTPKTKGSRREIRLSKGTVERLQAHKKAQQVEWEVIGGQWASSDKGGFVFASEVGTATNPRNFYRVFREIVEVTGVRRIRFHDLRHTAASLMILKGVPIKTVSERLGHSDVAFTLKVYTHLYDQQKQEAVFDLEELLPNAPEDMAEDK